MFLVNEKTFSESVWYFTKLKYLEYYYSKLEKEEKWRSRISSFEPVFFWTFTGSFSSSHLHGKSFVT